MRDYELVVLLHPDLEIDLDKPLKKIEKIIKTHKGVIALQDIWGKRKLAYPIDKEDFAVYVYFEVQMPPAAVSKVDAALNITDEVLRHLITNPVPKFEATDEDEETPDKKENEDKAEDTKRAKATNAKAKGGE